MGIKSTLHLNNGDHHAQNPNASVEVKEGQKKAKEANEIATMVQNALNHSPLFMPSSTERMSGFVHMLQQEEIGNFHVDLHFPQAQGVSFLIRPALLHLESNWLVIFSPQMKLPKSSPVWAVCTFQPISFKNSIRV